MALDGVSWVRGGLVETALAARGLAVRQNRRCPLLPPVDQVTPTLKCMQKRVRRGRRWKLILLAKLETLSSKKASHLPQSYNANL